MIRRCQRLIVALNDAVAQEEAQCMYVTHCFELHIEFIRGAYVFGVLVSRSLELVFAAGRKNKKTKYKKTLNTRL